MDRGDRLRYGICWWCGEPDSLFRLEGARLAGSEELPIPPSLPADQRDDFRVCPKCATAFGYARIAWDRERAELGRARGELLSPDARAVEAAGRIIARRVRDRIRRAIEEIDDAEAE